MMSQNEPRYVLVVEDEPDLAELIQIELEILYHGEVKVAHSVAEAAAILKTNPRADLVVCDHKMPGGTGDTLEKLILDSGWSIPFVVCSALSRKDLAPLYKSPAAFIEKPNVFVPLEVIAKQILKNSASQNNKKFVAVRISTLIRLGCFECDVFVRLSEEKFVKISRGNEQLDPEEARKFQARNVTKLYIRGEDALKVASAFQKNLALLSSAGSAIPADSLNLVTEATEIVQGLFQAFGWTADVSFMMEKGSELARKAFLQSPGILALLEERRRITGTYVDSRTSTLMFLCFGIAKVMEWDSDFTSAKLSMAAILHDITLSHEEIENMAELTADANNPYPSEAVKQYRNHPRKAADLLAGMHDVPPDVDKIILQHHERPDGKGFPEGLNQSRITPLSALFIIAEDLVLYLESRPNVAIQTVVQDFLASRADTYSAGNFNKIFARIAMQASTL